MSDHDRNEREKEMHTQDMQDYIAQEEARLSVNKSQNNFFEGDFAQAAPEH